MSISENYYGYIYTQYYNQLSSAQILPQAGTSTQTKETDSISSDSTSGKFTSPLAGLIESGIITSEQEEAIRDAFEKARMVHQTPSGAATASNSAKNPLESLVNTGVITNDQAEAVKNAFESDMKEKRMLMPPPQQTTGSNPMSEVLESLVSDGTISEDQEEKILNAFQAAFKAYDKQSDVFEDLSRNESFEVKL